MVRFENRIYAIQLQLQKLYYASFGELDLKLKCDRDDSNSDPMVQRKLVEICNDVERNPGPNPGSKTPINDNPRVSKIG